MLSVKDMKKLVIETSWFKVEVESKEEFMKYCAHTNLTDTFAKMYKTNPKDVYIYNGVWVITKKDSNIIFLKDFLHTYKVNFDKMYMRICD